MATSKIVFLVSGATGLVLLGYFGLFEVLFGYPVVWWLYAAASGLLGISVAAALVGKRHRVLAVFPVLGICLAWMLFVVPWNTRKPFLRDLDRIEVGMSEQEVRAIMDGYMVGTGWPTPGRGDPVTDGSGAGAVRFATIENSGELELAGAIVFRHSNDGAYNADWGIVQLERGRVASVEFSGD